MKNGKVFEIGAEGGSFTVFRFDSKTESGYYYTLQEMAYEDLDIESSEFKSSKSTSFVGVMNILINKYNYILCLYPLYLDTDYIEEMSNILKSYKRKNEIDLSQWANLLGANEEKLQYILNLKRKDDKDLEIGSLNFNGLHYQEKLDKIFAKGSLWKHRTFRTVFDPFSSEYSDTTIEQKIDFLRTCINNGIEIQELIFEYKLFYIEENKKHVIKSIEDGVVNLLSNMIAKEKK